MKKFSILAISLMLLTSCQEVKRMSKPDDLIAEDKMVEILTEISLLHGARSYNKNLMEEKGINPYPYLMKKFSIDSAQLVRSNNYYAENYKEYQKIYDRVQQRLEVLVKKYDSLRVIEEKIRDSIKELEKEDSLVGPEADSLRQDSVFRSLPPPVSRRRGNIQFRDTIN
ncbi:DUF4296 domain-containing protein [Salinimicrobium oceani]|uniref:DUF4296 domain-containing protein n=1 Tax=Salinimicrobium oceani TaxID=2722702 RepID=A0ABX1D2X2_9FLAO|nr:DUF4296 domain-containing protein [Salinimicrobium oceani]NJW53018.1 DUF4296 domain-containing protein [Salinimicrobium oceani]